VLVGVSRRFVISWLGRRSFRFQTRRREVSQGYAGTHGERNLATTRSKVPPKSLGSGLAVQYFNFLKINSNHPSLSNGSPNRFFSPWTRCKAFTVKDLSRTGPLTVNQLLFSRSSRLKPYPSVKASSPYFGKPPTFQNFLSRIATKNPSVLWTCGASCRHSLRLESVCGAGLSSTLAQIPW
jgi:hypothetical protein